MKKMLAVLLLAVGCATSYQSSDESISGGFSETRLSPDTWRVLVEGNGFATRSDIEQFVMRRCAELTLEQGKRYFVLDSRDAWTNVHRTGRSSVVTAPASEAVVTALSEKERNAFDAVEIIQKTNAAAQGKLSSEARKTLNQFSAS